MSIYSIAGGLPRPATAERDLRAATRATAAFHVGLGGWRMVRHMIAEEKFRGADIELLESPGWFTRTFTWKGEPEAVMRVYRRLKAIEAEQERLVAGEPV